MTQLTFNFDDVDTTNKKGINLEVGAWLSDKDVDQYKGRLIPFQELEKMKGQVVLREYKTESLTSYKLVRRSSKWLCLWINV